MGIHCLKEHDVKHHKVAPKAISSDEQQNGHCSIFQLERFYHPESTDIQFKKCNQYTYLDPETFL